MIIFTSYVHYLKVHVALIGLMSFFPSHWELLERERELWIVWTTSLLFPLSCEMWRDPLDSCTAMVYSSLDHYNLLHILLLDLTNITQIYLQNNKKKKSLKFDLINLVIIEAPLVGCKINFIQFYIEVDDLYHSYHFIN